MGLSISDHNIVKRYHGKSYEEKGREKEGGIERSLGREGRKIKRDVWVAKEK